MVHSIDVFNGDADGICALHQIRLHEPADNPLVTGVKRDIALLGRVKAVSGDRVTVLDIAVEKNREPLLRLLEAGVQVRYFDHHIPGEIPDHPNLDAHIDTDPRVCTGLLVNAFLGGRYLVWAVVAAFGDNLPESAREAAMPLALDEAQLAELQSLGECLNYNGYGETLEDLHFHPAELYRLVHRHAGPFTFIRDDAAYARLRQGYDEDIGRAASAQSVDTRPTGAIVRLPDAAWSRRVSGVYGNLLARDHPERAHAVLTHRSDGTYVVSVRAPVATRTGADTVCARFETGGGRKAAAGINRLPEQELGRFIATFHEVFHA
jgi:hypothetical protein